MKLRVLPRRDATGRASALMLSPDARRWCRLDGGRLRHAPRERVTTVLLTGSERERVDGLLDLRDGRPLELYATPAVFEQLTQAWPVLPVLERFCTVQWHLIPIAGERRHASFAVAGWPDLSFTALATAPDGGGERIALAVQDRSTGARLFLAPSLALHGEAGEWMHGADCVAIDRVQGREALERFARLPAPRKLLLDAAGARADWLAARGIEAGGGRDAEFEL